MHQLLEQTAQWGPIAGLLICFSVFMLVLLHQMTDRRLGYERKMSALPLAEEKERGE